ncbi:MAG TPA: SDR family oxidoreductase [Gemmatimonadaceae bacterium]|jgi:NAD(P)-dependent dehydrogenase (short-subunit alcohol dehydrogenase family)|nr:SDR family oxidoreductase [Gemmatimonadaceae bacterium]
MFSTSTILLTGVGADGQVGEVVANAFASLGASLVLVDRRPGRAEARAAALASDGRTARGYACDLTKPADVAALAERVRHEHGGALHALVHMAGGFAMSGPVVDSADDVWGRQIAVNLTTAYVTARAFLPLLRQGRGSIVFFASQAALPGASVAGMAAYAAAKSGVVALTRAIAAEERASGVRANAIAPATIRTAVNVSAMGADARYVEREQVADAVVFLCSPRASAISGVVLPLE